jgi:SAM-dependent methyltransferase
MMNTAPSKKPHWQDRHRYISNGRMAWYGKQGNEQYWYEYWKARLTPDYYASAAANHLTSDQMGKVLLQSMSPQGLHLEAGCGAGYWVAALRHHGLMIEGIEYSRDLVALVHAANPKLPVRQGNALHIDCPDNHYDSYLSIGVVEHRVEGPEPFLSEAYRVLKPGGKIFISVPYFGPLRILKSRLSLYDRNPPDLPFFQYGFTSKEFTNYLQKARFAIVKVQALYPHRLLLEEIPLYHWALNQPCGQFMQKWADWLLQNKDGHMLLVVGMKSSASPTLFEYMMMKKQRMPNIFM